MSEIITLGAVGFNPTGEYSNNKRYEKLDVVLYQGSAYIALKESLQQLPTNTEYWALLVQKGDAGPTGNGISSIEKTSTSGLVDTYTTTFTNGQTTTYQITNGANGSVVDVQVDGTSVVDNGVANIIGISNMKQELEDMYNLLPKVSGTGESITLTNTKAGKMEIVLKGNTEQTGTPTISSPIPVHVVSGNNSIIIGDGTDSTTYTVNLGSIELCKIGTYQDYIYKNNNKWYVHKEIGKYVLDGTNNAFSSKSGQPGNSYVFNASNFIAGPASNVVPSLLSNKFIPKSWDDRNNYLDSAIIFIYLGVSSHLFRFGESSSLTTLELANAWLVDNNVTLYGRLATPTDTEITDSTLISQLDALESARSYDTQTNISQTNNDKAFIITASALTDIGQ